MTNTSASHLPRDLIGYNGRPPVVAWPGGAKVAVALTVLFAEGSERSIGDGDTSREPGWYAPHRTRERDVALETMWEYGTRAGVWRLLDAFDEYEVAATFHATALTLERTQRAAEAICARGHEVAAFGYRYTDPTTLSRDEEAESIARAVESITKTTGNRPKGWLSRRTPGVHTRELLIREGGFSYDSDSYADDLPYWTTIGDSQHLTIPSTLANADRHFEDKWFGSPADFEKQLTSTFDRLLEEGATTPKMMPISLHPHIGGHPGRVQALTNFFDHVESNGGAWFARRDDIAEFWTTTQAQKDIA